MSDEVVAETKEEELRIAALKHRFERAQRFVRQHVKLGRSLADELIAERRAEAKRESDEDENRTHPGT